nr:hypothetical protein [uncultured Carboxylicivirga sp.]
MKAKQLLYTVLLGMFVFSTNSIISQERRSDRNQGRRTDGRTRVTRSSTKEYRYNIGNKENCKKQKYNKNYRESHQNMHVSNHCIVGCNVVNNHPSTMHVHTKGYAYHNHHVYYQQLPSPHYISFVIGYDTFYHCRGRFYTYWPGSGFREVELQLPTVRYAPRRCSIRKVNGFNYYFKDGYYYIPYQYGFYRVRDHSSESICRVRH